MSTHQMHQVEEMCERILLIDHGRQVLYGPLQEIRRRFASNTVEVSLRGKPGDVAGVETISGQNGSYRLLLKDGTRPEELLKTLVDRPDIAVERFERVETSLDEIFIQVVGRDVTSEEVSR
jgi:ABC-2 type transport system ATP-binding protein